VVLACFSVESIAADYDDALQAAISGDSRNEGIDVQVTKQNTKSVVFDIQAIAPNKTPQDVFRLLLQFIAESHKAGLPALELVLAAFGNPKFVVPAQQVEVTGRDYGSQNVMYTLRTFPESLLTPAGESAYAKHEGGLLYLMRVQMGDFNDFLSKWFVQDLVEKREEERGFVKPGSYVDDEAF